MSIYGLIEAAQARPNRNIDGALGPRCSVCSGLGSYLVLGGDSRGMPVTRAASRCACEGSGLDLVQIERQDREALWTQIHALESRFGLPLSSRWNFPDLKASRQYWTECIAWATADGVAVASSVGVDTILFPTVLVPANYMADGRTVALRLKGKYSTTTGTVSHVYSVKWGGAAGVVICKTGTVTLLVSMTNAYFEIDIEMTTRSNGSSGTIMGNGTARAYGGTAPTIGSATGAPAIAPLTAGGQTVPAVATCDLTADTALAITLAHGASSASNTATGLQLSIDSKN